MTSRAVPVLLAAGFSQFAAGIGFWSFGLLAPELAAETGLNERDFGLSITFTFAGTLLSSAFTGAWVRRFGGAGAVARFFAIMAGALALVLTGTWTGAMIAAFLFGLGYGPQGPVGMTLVAQTAKAEQRGFFLALRHATVPLAAGISGRVLPPFMLWAGWQAGVLSVGAVLVAAMLFALVASRLVRGRGRPGPPGRATAPVAGDLCRAPAAQVPLVGRVLLCPDTDGSDDLQLSLLARGRRAWGQLPPGSLRRTCT